jgi:hypothetical protein
MLLCGQTSDCAGVLHGAVLALCLYRSMSKLAIPALLDLHQCACGLNQPSTLWLPAALSPGESSRCMPGFTNPGSMPFEGI